MGVSYKTCSLNKYMGILLLNDNSQGLLKKCIIIRLKSQLKGQTAIIQKKSFRIPAILSNSTIYIYKGNSYQRLYILRYHQGKLLGEFCLTRKPFCYLKRDNYFNKLFKR